MTHILVIEDEDQVRSFLHKILEQEGYEVSDAPNGAVGMKIQRESPAELIITDIIMPEKEGIEIIMEIKKDFPGTKIIAISGGGQAGINTYLDMAKKLGAHSVLAKPFEIKEIISETNRLLEKT